MCYCVCRQCNGKHRIKSDFVSIQHKYLWISIVLGDEVKIRQQYWGLLSCAFSWASPCTDKLTVLHCEHWTDVAPRTYINKVLHPPHTSCAISVPERINCTRLVVSTSLGSAAICSLIHCFEDRNRITLRIRKTFTCTRNWCSCLSFHQPLFMFWD